MASPSDGLLGIGVVLGLLLCWFSYHVYRTHDRSGTRSFAAFGTVLGVGSIGSGLTGIFLTQFDTAGEIALWAQLPILFWAFSTLPWFLFALQYTGMYTQIRRRTLGVLFLPYGLIVIQITLNLTNFGRLAILSALGSLVYLYFIALMLVGSSLILWTTYSYGHLSLGLGISLVAASFGPVALWNMLTIFSDTIRIAAAGVYTGGVAIAALGIGIALSRYDLFDSTPAVGTFGERAIVRETDDLVFVVDDRERVIKLNETAVESLGVSRSGALGTELRDLLEYTTDELLDVETVTLQTIDGNRKYDPQVSAVTDQHDNELGAMISLRDVTERELREQRLAVLNRVLRHNLRNKVDVIKSHAEAVADTEDDHRDTILEAADSITDLGQRARRIDGIVSGSAEETTIDLARTVRQVVDRVSTDRGEPVISVEAPESTTTVTNPRAVEAALESAIDNAVTYADATVSITVDERPDGHGIRIIDDGPGLPDHEIESLQSGMEAPLQHGSGLGLWQLKWAVMALNGQLSFDTDDGTTVQIYVPDLQLRGDGD